MLSTRVCLIVLLTALVPARWAQAQTQTTTALFVYSEPGDYLGQGLPPRTYTPDDGTFATTSTSNSYVRLTLTGPNFSFWWNLEFSTANDAPMTVGSYLTARGDFLEMMNGLRISANSRGCGGTGRYLVREIEFGPGNTVVRFAADYEIHCGGAVPASFGAIRYNSTVADLTPFHGNYPDYSLSAAVTGAGRVTGGGLDCGAGGLTCGVTFGAATQVALTATPDPGSMFVGWAGDCQGFAATTVHVYGPRTCTAQFVAASSSVSKTLFYVQSDAADYVGAGKHTMYVPATSEWMVFSGNNGNRVSIRIDNGIDDWSLNFAAPEGQTLTVGEYDSARRYPFTPFDGLDVSGFARGCNQLTGRFVILELAIAANGTVQRFAADFEQHCEDAAAAVFGAVRYNSTIDEARPFAGVYPLYHLSIVPPTGGRVTGVGINCGGGGACELPLVSAAMIDLTAVPDSGHVFMGWTGACRGGLATTVHVNGPKTCTALFEPIVSPAARTYLYLESQPGDSIGMGRQVSFSAANSRWFVSAIGTPSGRRVSIDIREAIDTTRLDFSAPEGQTLVPGYYGTARRQSFTHGNGLDVSYSSSGCNRLTGRFVVLEIAFASDGSIQRFAADFEQHCNDNVPALFGAVRYNSTIDEVVPFGGGYPAYRLELAAPQNGHIGGIGLNCGGGATQCVLPLGNAAQVAITATPDFGYTFMGWTEDCSGGAQTTVHVTGPKRCGARFEPTVAVAPRTLVRWDSQPGNSISQGRSEVFSPANSVWTVRPWRSGNGVDVFIRSIGPTSALSWVLGFQAPAGQMLQVGHYPGAAAFEAPGVPVLRMSGNSASCGSGEFTVREVVFGAQDTVLRFAADFVLSCGSAATGPLLTGTVQYNSIVDVPQTTVLVDPPSLRFASIYVGTTVTLQPAPQTVRVTLSRANVGWTASANQPWIALSPSSGTGSANMTVAVHILGGHPGTGTASGMITIRLTDGTGTSQAVPVTVTLRPSGTTTPPFGIIDTPVPITSGVTGAVPITGWALDDLEVTGVTICRAAVSPEQPPAFDMNCGGTPQVFVGRAVFVEGSRPDVQTGFPTHPRNNLGGWGFMLLTNTLPDQGNGTFTFYVYARDREGQSTLLGTRTMMCDNAHASAPFGTIDTPGQGETVSGSSYVNFGWALTQNPKHIPTNGSTLMVYVDGVPVGSPSYGHPRADIAAIFPGLANSDGAIGFRHIDTTGLTNGLHTIVWTATDSSGVTSGLGSRFFRVANGVASATATAATTSALSSSAIEAAPLDATPIVARRSWAADAPWRSYGVGQTGRAVLRGEEIDRFELALDAQAGETYAGYLRVGAELQPLPVGSRLDPETGGFTWSPGVGFVGAYDLLFVRSAGSRAVARREVRIILAAKGSGHVGPQVVIDTPRSQQDVAQPFALGGWAADLDAAAGTGIATLHVWAYPLAGGPPVFLGTPQLAGARPDVAAIHGDQFAASGFGLTVQGLPHGHYDLAVFPWSNVTGGFATPQIVRITAR